MVDDQSSNRPEMVEAARKFMLTDKVRSTPFEEQRQFLISKGVTPAEISEARASIPEQALSAPVQSDHIYHPLPTSNYNKATSFAQSVLVIGSVSYAGYRFLRSYVLPKFFDIPDPASLELRRLQSQVNELQNSMKFVLDSVSQTTQALTQLSETQVDISSLEKGINNITSLLVNRDAFAPIGAPKAIPDWQSEVPANMKKVVMDVKEDEEIFEDSVTDNIPSEKATPV
ncbi:unnamed protein product [Auanema sp. JU1783]|nr:unnamed protein product [Auanema sp. JU1783]